MNFAEARAETEVYISEQGAVVESLLIDNFDQGWNYYTFHKALRKTGEEAQERRLAEGQRFNRRTAKRTARDPAH
jgi:hypothetical protein